MRSMVGGSTVFLAGIVASLSFPPAIRAAVPSQSEIIRAVKPDPTVRRGILPNGVRYFVKQSVLPARGLSLRLAFDVGSIEEQDDERGFAHFVEHLAFRKTRSAPDGGLSARFAKLGVAFGRDQNAETSEFSTSYRIDFNSADAGAIEEGFRWLRDVADGVLFSDDAVASEHGVIVAEQTLKADESLRVQQEIATFMKPELRSTFRQPNGLAHSLPRDAKARLQRFYAKWYRPENAVVVVVGDQSAVTLEESVRATFASWRSTAPLSQRAQLGRVKVDRGVDAIAIAAPSFPKATTACRLQPPSSQADERNRILRETRRSIWQGILNERLKRVVNDGNRALLGGAFVTEENVEVSATCLVAMPIGDEWQTALAAVQLEVQRFAKDGPTEAELEEQVAEQRSLLRAAISSAKARTSATIADSVLERVIDRRTPVSPEEAMHAFNVAVEDLDSSTVKASFLADWSGAGPLLALTMPTSVEKAALRESWVRNAEAKVVPAYADVAPVVWPYKDFGKAGTVLSREEIARPGFTRFHLSNGLVLNFKRVATERNTVELRADFGAGRRQVANEDYITASFGSGMLLAGGLGRLSTAEIERAFRNVSWRFEFDMKNHSFEMSHSSVAANLPVMLEVFTAFLSDPGFRDDADARLPSAFDMVFRNLATDAQARLSDAMMRAIDPSNPERMPEQSDIAGMKSSEFARVLKGAITSEALEITIAGDVDEETVVRLVGKTLGALPPRQRVDRARADTHFLRFPDQPMPVIRVSHDGAADQAAAKILWPLYVATPARRREEYALQLVAEVFNEALRGLCQSKCTSE